MDAMLKLALELTEKQNQLEDEIAMRWFGKKFDELSYDDKELVSYEAIDMMGSC